MTEHEVPAGGGPDDARPAPAGQARCPSCRALRPPAVTWCTQCYARFDVPQHGAAGTGAPPASGGDPVTAVVAPDPELGPVHPVRADRAPADPQEVQARAEELLARLSSEDDGDRVRSWSGRFASRGARIALAVVGTVLLTGLLFGAMAALGALL